MLGMNERARQNRQWAEEETAEGQWGDLRFRRRASSMLTDMLQRTAGQITSVFESSARRQGAYDFVENDRIRASVITQSLGRACFSRTDPEDYVFVPVDGSSIKLTDRLEIKGFGSIGSRKSKAQGFKVITALGLDARGTPLGIAHQVWWARQGKKRGQDHQKRKLEDKETARWCETIEDSCRRAREVDPSLRLCFLLDREADGVHTLKCLDACGHDFIVRSNHNRRLEQGGRNPKYLHKQLLQQKTVGSYQLHVSPGFNRRERIARMQIRFGVFTLCMRDKATGKKYRIRVNAVSATELYTTPRGEKALSWILLTNRNVETFEQARAVASAYCLRWRIEEFHRTLKSGACNVEDSQLQSANAVIKWATLMSSVAARIERIKILARTDPARPAIEEFSKAEVTVISSAHDLYKKKTNPPATENPTIAEAVRWLAELGGYTGKSSGGLPGSVTIARGLDRISLAVEMEEKRQSKRKIG